VIIRRIDNTMLKRNRAKRQIIVVKILHRKLKIEQHKLYSNEKGDELWYFPVPIVAVDFSYDPMEEMLKELS
jgi:hypothetical protein